MKKLTSPNMIPLSEWAKHKGVSYVTAWKWWKRGKLPVRGEQMPSGMILVEHNVRITSDQGVWIYARVNQEDENPSLQTQVESCQQYAIAKGWHIEGTVTECNASTQPRPKLWKLLSSKPSRIITLDPSRFIRLDFECWQKYLEAQGCELITLHSELSRNGVLEDVIFVVKQLLQKHWGVKRRSLLLEYVEQLMNTASPL